MRSIFAGVLYLLLTTPLTTNAACFPDNTLYIPPSSDLATEAITHKAFDRAINKVIARYEKYVNALGYNLVFQRLWSDGTVNSDTYVSGSDWIIRSYGGLARYPGMNTVQAYAAVACHELGHHMGGRPVYSGFGNRWASVEGESDYWALKECMREVGFSAGEAQAGALQLAKVLAALGREPIPDIKKIDTRVVRRTFEDHPPAQCRLDTMMNGLSCIIHGDMYQKNPKTNSCFDYPSPKTYAIGSRPRCWFHP